MKIESAISKKELANAAILLFRTNRECYSPENLNPFLKFCEPDTLFVILRKGESFEALDEKFMNDCGWFRKKS